MGSHHKQTDKGEHSAKLSATERELEKVSNSAGGAQDSLAHSVSTPIAKGPVWISQALKISEEKPSYFLHAFLEESGLRSQKKTGDLKSQEEGNANPPKELNKKTGEG